MLKESIGTGATIEEAQKEALESLNAPADAEVQIEVLELPVKKTLGIFGGSRAKVRAYYEDLEEKNAAPVKKEAKEKQRSEEPNRKEIKEKTQAPIKAPAVPVAEKDLEESVKLAVDYLKKIVSGMGIASPEIEVTKAEEEYFISLTCDEDYGILIGKRGETLDSVQYLVRLVANRGKESEDYVRISVNVGNYRQKRENTLKELARKNASKVLKYGRNIALEPMNPFERRIIHTVIAEMENVTSYSVGADAERKVIISLKEGVKPTNPRSFNNNRGGYNRNNRDNRDRDNRGSKGNYQRNNNNSRYNNNGPKNNNAPQAHREPKSDAAGTSLYGKIQPK